MELVRSDGVRCYRSSLVVEQVANYSSRRVLAVRAVIDSSCFSAGSSAGAHTRSGVRSPLSSCKVGEAREVIPLVGGPHPSLEFVKAIEVAQASSEWVEQHSSGCRPHAPETCARDCMRTTPGSQMAVSRGPEAASAVSAGEGGLGGARIPSMACGRPSSISSQIAPLMTAGSSRRRERVACGGKHQPCFHRSVVVALAIVCRLQAAGMRRRSGPHRGCRAPCFVSPRGAGLSFLHDRGPASQPAAVSLHRQFCC